MKKLTLLALTIGLFAFTSCSDDDDGGSSSSCKTCTIEIMGIENVSEYCDNGDGTMTVTSEGQETTIELEEGMSFDDYIAGQEQLGDCK